jgi:hypothetical protein
LVLEETSPTLHISTLMMEAARKIRNVATPH